ncbi:hypothetical protein CM15mP5_2930 [bacterium]|nr:MAG: hypothetical protein CM15mP5_2930 [bacterium]
MNTKTISVRGRDLVTGIPKQLKSAQTKLGKL